MNKDFFLAAAAVALGCSAAPPTSYGQSSSTPKYLIEWSFGNHDVPPYVAAHLDFIESQPFDGMVINTYVGRNLFLIKPPANPGGTAWTQKQAYGTFSPLTPTSFKHFTQNFALVDMGLNADPPDLDDDAGWAIALQSVSNFAAAVKQMGLRGIFLDNEVYSYDYWRRPPGPGSSATKQRDQARMRGEQVMKALANAYPNIVVIVPHGPYISCPDLPKDLQPVYANAGDLSGYFFAGMAQAISAPAILVDGGELYHLRTPQDFQRSYQWRKYGIAATSTACNIVPASMRPNGWAQSVSIGFGVYDKPSKTVEGKVMAMDSQIAASTTANALRYSDKYAWHYSESMDWWAATSADENPKIQRATGDWVQAVRSGKNKNQ